MLFHRLYRQTVTQLNAINTIVDYVRTVYGYGGGHIERALKVLEARAEVLRARKKRNRENRGKSKV